MSGILNNEMCASEPLTDPSHARTACDADLWRRRLGLPYCTLAILRDMRVGDEIVLFDYAGPPMLSGGMSSRAGASVERERGGWHFSALWMLNVGSARKRGHILTFGTFRVEKGRTLSWENGDLAAWKLFEHVVRLSARLSRMARAAGDRRSSVSMQPYPWRDFLYSDDVVPFLQTIAAPPRDGRTAREPA